VTLPMDPGRRRRPGPPEGVPEVFVADEQSDVPVELDALAQLAEGVLREEGVRGACELSLYFVDEHTIAELNEKFLGGTGPTDVLAFPMDDDLVLPGRQPDQGGRGPGTTAEPGDPPTLLGDVVVCPSVAVRQAAERGVSADDELALLVVHGVLHLLDYDHAEHSEGVVMRRREQELLSRFRELEQRS